MKIHVAGVLYVVCYARHCGAELTAAVFGAHLFDEKPAAAVFGAHHCDAKLAAAVFGANLCDAKPAAAGFRCPPI